MKVLVTCPPMLGMIDEFRPIFEDYGVEITTPNVVQTLSVEELKKIVPDHDGWIIGDDPASGDVFEAGRGGSLRAAVKWGIGTDNIDLSACDRLGIDIINTPHMFGQEVADIAQGYVIALARHTFEIDREVRQGGWPKPRGISLAGKTLAVLGFGDIGLNIARRAVCSGMRVFAYDPFAKQVDIEAVTLREWPVDLGEVDFLVIACALTDETHHLIDDESLALLKSGARIVNVSRGSVICEPALERALEAGKVHSAALDVFEAEPLPMNSYLRAHPRVIFGSHNASNTADAVLRTSQLAIERLMQFLGREIKASN